MIQRTTVACVHSYWLLGARSSVGDSVKVGGACVGCAWPKDLRGFTYSYDVV